MNLIAERLRKVREERGISQKKLGMILGLSDKAISAYEQGRTYPPIDTLYKIAEELKKPITYFLNDDQDEQDMLDRVEGIENMVKSIEGDLAELKRMLQARDNQKGNTPPNEPTEDGVTLLPNGDENN